MSTFLDIWIYVFIYISTCRLSEAMAASMKKE